MSDHSNKRKTWKLDQLIKSRFFHQKLHDWGLLEIAQEIEAIRGENLEWDKKSLNIQEAAWNKVIHRGIKPVRIFAHPDVLVENPRRVSYYRMLSMVSQKSMSNVGLGVTDYEGGKKQLDHQKALKISRHLNEIISSLIEQDNIIEARELDLWRGMAAGTQAQGSYQNIKGNQAEKNVKKLIRDYIQSKDLVSSLELSSLLKGKINLKDGREIEFGKDPDVGIYRNNRIEVVIDIKGGIDAAGIHERHGAALKSFERAKEANPQSITVLVFPFVALTPLALEELKKSPMISYFFDIDKVLSNPEEQKKFFEVLSL